MSNDERRFLDLEETDLAGWRSIPVTRLLLDHLESERDKALLSVADAVEAGKPHEAAIATGGLRLCQSLLGAFHPPERLKPEPDEPFVDAAARKVIK